MQFSKFFVHLVLFVFVIPQIHSTNEINEDLKRIRKSLTNETSGDYCFDNQYGLNGPINTALVYAPMSPNKMNVKFLLFTCDNNNQSQNFSYLSDSSEWKNSNFDPNITTRFIVHGWNEKYPGNSAGYNWMEQMKNRFLEKSCVNVIAVDWSLPAHSIYYYQSAANTKVVGQMIGCVVNKLKSDLNLSPNNVHLIGHSLGGQVVGFAGKRVNDPKVRRITALDPAGPGFKELPESDKLAVTDGQCVDVLHTNGARTVPIVDGYGHFKPMGNNDFYPNGGHKQPGCGTGSVADLQLCNHIRSNKYAIADLNYTDINKCQLIGYSCSSYDEFNLGKCADCGSDGKGCKPMPLNLDFYDDTQNCDPNLKHIEYYLNTGNVENVEEYCLFHYQIIVNIQQTENQCLGKININLSNGKQIEVKNENKNKLDSENGSKRFTKLFTDSEELGDIIGAQIDSISGCLVNKIEFYFMSSLDDSVRQRMSFTLCSRDGQTFSDKC